jgi:hypothetical protein
MEGQSCLKACNPAVCGCIGGTRRAQRHLHNNFQFHHGIGVATTVSYEVKRIDSDYFVEED